MQINLTQNWRTPDRARGERLWTPGHYSVPQDMPEKIAAAAIKAGAAEEIKPAAAVAAPEPVTEEVAAPAPTPTFRGRRARRGAPENKSEVE